MKRGYVALVGDLLNIVRNILRTCSILQKVKKLLFPFRIQRQT